MSTHTPNIWPAAGRASVAPAPAGKRRGTVIAVSVPTTPLLASALTHATWSDAYAVSVSSGTGTRDPQDWADKIFLAPPWRVRFLFGLRELAVRVVGIEPGNSHTFDTLDRTSDEVLLGIDQKHLSFRASVLVELDRVVVSTVVEVHNRRGRAYSALVRRIHPWVVRAVLVRASRQMDVVA